MLDLLTSSPACYHCTTDAPTAIFDIILADTQKLLDPHITTTSYLSGVLLWIGLQQFLYCSADLLDRNLLELPQNAGEGRSEADTRLLLVGRQPTDQTSDTVLESFILDNTRQTLGNKLCFMPQKQNQMK